MVRYISSSKDTFSPVSTLNGGKRFKKEVLYEGTFVHQATKKKHVFSRSDLESIAANSNALANSGVLIPFPDGHTYDSMSNLGFWDTFSVEDSSSHPGKAGLFAIAQVDDASLASKIGTTIKAVSVCLEKDVPLVDGSKISGVTCTHVAATGYPVVPKQKNFEDALFSIDQPEESEDDKMNKLLMLAALALGLPKESTEDEVATAFSAFLDASKADKAKIADLESRLAPTEPPATMSAREIALTKELAEVKHKATKKTLDDALSAGRIDKPLHDLFSSLVAIPAQEVVHFGADAPVSINPVDVISSFLSTRKDNHEFNTKPTIRSSSATEEESERLARRKRQALAFQEQGYEVVWNEDKTDFSVNNKGGK